MMEPETILDTDKLYRRLREEDFKEGQLKSSAFSDAQKEPSVHLERLADFNSIEEVYSETIGYAIFLTHTLRKHEFDAEHRPLSSDVSHSVILTLSQNGFTKSARKKLKKLVSQILNTDI
jgi:hypothetical protein